MVDFYAELELPGLGKIDRKIKIQEPKEELQFPLAVCLTRVGVMRDLMDTLGENYKRYKFIHRGMYPSEWGFREVDEQGNTKPYVKAFTVLYELGEIV